MKIRKPVVSLVICLAVVLLIGSSALADTVKLRDGSILKGKVVSYTQRKFTIEVYIGGAISQHVVPVEEVESVEFDETDQGTISRAQTDQGTVSRARSAYVTIAPCRCRCRMLSIGDIVCDSRTLVGAAYGMRYVM